MFASAQLPRIGGGTRDSDQGTEANPGGTDD